MKKYLAAAGLVAILAVVNLDTATLREIRTGENRYERAQRQTVLIETSRARGTAFIVKRADYTGRVRVYAWTAAHVIESESSLFPSEESEEPNKVDAVIDFRHAGEKAGRARFPARVIDYSTEVDIALLEIQVPPDMVEAVEFSGDFPRVGQRIFHVGNFLGALDDSVSTGVISQVGVFPDNGWPWGTMDQVDAMSPSGSSGGPIFDHKTGKVVGILVGGIRGLNGLGFIVPVRAIESWAISRGFEWAVCGR